MYMDVYVDVYVHDHEMPLNVRENSLAKYVTHRITRYEKSGRKDIVKKKRKKKEEKRETQKRNRVSEVMEGEYSTGSRPRSLSIPREKCVS